MRKGPHNFPFPPLAPFPSLPPLFQLQLQLHVLINSCPAGQPPHPPPPLAMPLAEACSIWRALATAFTLFASHFASCCCCCCKLLLFFRCCCCCFYFCCCCCCCCWWPTGLSTLCAFVCPTHKRPAKQAGKGKWGWHVEGGGGRTCNLIF